MAVTVSRFQLNCQEVLGMGTPDGVYRVVNGPLQHGDTYTGFSLDTRTIQALYTVDSHLIVRSEGIDRHFTTLRQQFDNFLAPAENTTFNFCVELADGTIYYLRNVFVESIVEASSTDPRYHALTIRLLCPDPLWLRRGVHTATIALLAGDTVEPAAVVMDGTWYAYPRVVITGRFVNPAITNETTGQTIALERSLGASETVTITSGLMGVTVRSSLAGDITHQLADDSDMEFYLTPFSAGGLNALRATAAGLTGDGTFTLTWEDTFIAL